MRAGRKTSRVSLRECYTTPRRSGCLRSIALMASIQALLPGSRRVRSEAAVDERRSRTRGNLGAIWSNVVTRVGLVHWQRSGWHCGRARSRGSRGGRAAIDNAFFPLSAGARSPRAPGIRCRWLQPAWCRSDHDRDGSLIGVVLTANIDCDTVFSDVSVILLRPALHWQANGLRRCERAGQPEAAVRSR
jgi:hypothetical protein